MTQKIIRRTIPISARRCNFLLHMAAILEITFIRYRGFANMFIHLI